MQKVMRQDMAGELRESRQFGMTHPEGGRLRPWGKSLRRNYSLAHIRFCILYEQTYLFPFGDHISLRGHKPLDVALIIEHLGTHICLLLPGCLLLIFSFFFLCEIKYMLLNKDLYVYLPTVFNCIAVLLGRFYFTYFTHKNTEIQGGNQLAQAHATGIEHPFFLTAASILFPLGLSY